MSYVNRTNSHNRGSLFSNTQGAVTGCVGSKSPFQTGGAGHGFNTVHQPEHNLNLFAENTSYVGSGVINENNDGGKQLNCNSNFSDELSSVSQKGGKSRRRRLKQSRKNRKVRTRRMGKMKKHLKHLRKSMKTKARKYKLRFLTRRKKNLYRRKNRKNTRSKSKKYRNKRRMRGGSATGTIGCQQYMSNVPVSQGYSTGGSINKNEIALANPVPHKKYNNCTLP